MSVTLAKESDNFAYNRTSNRNRGRNILAYSAVLGAMNHRVSWDTAEKLFDEIATNNLRSFAVMLDINHNR